MEVKFNFYVSTNFIGSEHEEEVTLTLPDDYDCELDTKEYIEDEYKQWMYEHLDACWTIVKE